MSVGKKRRGEERRGEERRGEERRGEERIGEERRGEGPGWSDHSVFVYHLNYGYLCPRTPDIS